MRNTRRLALLPVAALVLAACQQGSSNIESIDDLAGETVCVGEATTYLFWIEGTLSLPESAGEISEPPEGINATSLPTDIDCAEAWQSGRTDELAGWLRGLPSAQASVSRLDGRPSAGRHAADQ